LTSLGLDEEQLPSFNKATDTVTYLVNRASSSSSGEIFRVA